MMLSKAAVRAARKQPHQLPSYILGHQFNSACQSSSRNVNGSTSFETIKLKSSGISILPGASITPTVAALQLNSIRQHSSKKKNRSKKKDKKEKNQSSAVPKVEITKTSASSSSSSTTTLPPKPSDQIKEEEIRDLHGEIAFHHNHAQYHEALQVSKTLLQKSIDHFDIKHPVTASAYNNIGLMNKYLGNLEDAKDAYHEALRIYYDTVGSDHANYAATLNNLGNLLRSQSMAIMNEYDDDDDNGDNETSSSRNKRPVYTAMQRVKFNDMAIEYFEEALKIRQEELGMSHPHTITSRSNLGAAMASMLLQEHANKNRLKTSDREKTEELGSSLYSSKFTATRWEAAEQHLRTALNTAVQNPKGKTVPPSSISDTSPSSPSSQNSSMGQIQTLSAAGAAQNLAVFLKSKADILLQTSNANPNNAPTSSHDTNDMYAEAHSLYQGALHVRTEILSISHPDTISTKFSLAELLVAAYNDEESANRLRQEILDTYSVEEK